MQRVRAVRIDVGVVYLVSNQPGEPRYAEQYSDHEKHPNGPLQHLFFTLPDIHHLYTGFGKCGGNGLF